MGTSASKRKGGELNEGVYCSKTDSGAAEDVVEVTVCREDDLENGEMKVYELGQQGSVLLVKEDGTFSALGTKCTHYNAPLIKGVLSNGKIRCPWHGACFNSKTGDIEDFPGLDSLPCYRVRVDGGEVKVSASSHEVGKNKRVKPTSKRTVDDKRTFIVIGGVWFLNQFTGVLPSTEFLENTNIKLNTSKQIVVDEYMKTNVDGIFAGGDIVEFPLTVMDARVNIGHWQLAMAHGRCAALNMLNKNEKLLTVPFFWSMLFGKSVRYAGYGGKFDKITMHGDAHKLQFVAYYIREGKVVAVASMNNDPIAAKFASLLLSGKALTKDDVECSSEEWP
ncbi:apoptosis-inducing factor 3-like [Centruroides sculpturatus]|uniref:apoptosis-inducing factor 3-like n=1 Tax=Centruroides sculpturatus TaxID=218467 RepID=UPI000C6E687C|nr:apoptosis-inducing factor 3-like [Centruroides sculpturatus]